MSTERAPGRPAAIALLLAVAAALAGCDYPEPRFQEFQKRFALTEERTLAAGWMPSRNIPPEPVWCYRTLARPDCYAEPEPPREQRRLISSFERVGY